jgi:hypothetical protein
VALDPTTREWKQLPVAPLVERAPVVGIWTGSEYIVWGDVARSDDAVDGAAFNPTTRTWRRIADAPQSLNQATAAWTGQEMIVFGADLGDGNISDTINAQAIAYNPATDSWRQIDTSGDYGEAPGALSPQASSVSWMGDRLLAYDYDLKASTYDPLADSWSAIDRVPLDFRECYPASAATSDHVMAWYCGTAAVYNEDVGRWTELTDMPPRARETVAYPVAANDVFLLAGTHNYGPLGPVFWAYKP